jgi:prepilin-type processing-associated H-X9-DG protein
LAALLLPALSYSRERACRVVCSSLMRQSVTCGIQYLGDNRGYFPDDPDEWLYTKASITPAHPIGCRWHDRDLSPEGGAMRESRGYQGRMWSYLAPDFVGLCPIFRDVARRRQCENPSHPAGLGVEPQYNSTMNAYLGSTRPGGVRRLDDVRKEEEVFFFADENAWSVPGGNGEDSLREKMAPLSARGLDDTVLLITPTPQVRDCFGTFHGGDSNRGYGNVSFLDGHVEKIDFADQLRKVLHGGRSRLGPAGNLHWAWAAKTPPPGGWDAQ